MRWNTVLVLAALLVPLGAHADTYVLRESHTDSFYSGGRVTPAADATTETWIGEKRLAYISPSTKVIVDLENNTAAVVNLRDRTWVETALPLDLAGLLSEEEYARIQPYARQGTVADAEVTKTFDGRKCRAWNVEDWIVYEGSRYDEREMRTWTTADVPFDLTAFRKMFVQLAKLQNLGDEYLGLLLEIDGFQVASEETRYDEGQAVRTETRVKEITVKDPPVDAYAVPEGFTKKDKLTLQDLRG
jgi:hypothetical protein